MIFNALLVTVLAICLITDIKNRKIYNWVLLPSLCLAVILNVWLRGFNGISFSLVGFATGLAILIIPYLFGGIGAGDVKLLAFIGTLKGSIFVLNTAFYMAIFGGIIALAIIIYKNNIICFLKSFYKWLFSSFIGVKYKLQINTSGNYPYGTAIVCGALLCLLFKEAWII